MFNTLAKTPEYLNTASLVVRDLDLSQKSKTWVLEGLFTQYLNIEKKRFSAVSPNFIQILHLFYQVHGNDLIDLVPSAVSAVSSPETKVKLYNFISQGFSCMPFDPKTDLPIVLGLLHPNTLIRKSALSQITDIQPFIEPIKTLIFKEKDMDILLIALNLPLTCEFSEVLQSKLEEFMSFPVSPLSITQKIFSVLTSFPTNDVRHAKTILKSYDNPYLRDLVNPALMTCTYPLFKGYQGEDLSIFLKKTMLAHWNQCVSSILELLDCTLIFSLLPEVFEEVYKCKQNLHSLVIVAGAMFDRLIKTNCTDFQVFQSLIRAIPAINTLDHDLQLTYKEHLLAVLRYVIPLAQNICKEILSKHFSDNVLQTLCTLSNTSPEALHLACCVTFHSELNNSFLYVLPYLLVSLAKDVQYRTSALICIEQYLSKTLPEVSIEFSVLISEQFEKVEVNLVGLKKFLRKILRFKSGVLQDPSLIFYCMGKVKTGKVNEILAVGLGAQDLDRKKYFSVLKPVKSDLLTNFLVKYGKGPEDAEFILDRFADYNDWKDFPHSSYLLQCLENKELLDACFKAVTPARFKKLPQKTFFEALIRYLPLSNVKEYLESLEIPSDLYLEQLENCENVQIGESILQILQGQSQSFDILVRLIKLLSDQISEKNEYLRDLILVTIRIHGSQATVSDDWLEIIADVMFKSESVETKKSALLAMCSFSAENQKKVINLLEKIIMNLASIDEYNFFKSVLRKFEQFDISNIVKSLLIFVHDHKIGLKEAENLVFNAGQQYLHLMISVFFDYDVEDVFEVVMRFNNEVVIKSFVLVLTASLDHARLICFAFGQMRFVETFTKNIKNLPPLFSELFSVVFNYSAKSLSDKSIKKTVDEILGALQHAVNDKLFSNAFFYLLKDSNYSIGKEAVEFLLPHIEKNPGCYFNLINPLCEILENHISKISVLHREKYLNLAVYLQTVLSLLYILLKFYKKTGDILVIYGNCLLGYINSNKPEVKCAACLVFSTFFKEKNLDILPFANNFVDQLLILSDSEQEIVKNAAVGCLVEALKTSDEVLSPFFERIIKLSCESSHKTLRKVLIKNVSSRFIIENLQKASESLQSPESLQNLFTVIQKIFSKLSSSQATGYKTLIFTFFTKILTSLSAQPLKFLSKIVSSLSKSFATFCVNLKNSQLKPSFLEFFTWSVEKSETNSYDYSKIYLFTNLVLELTKTLKKHFVPYYGHFIDLFYDVFEEFSVSYSSKKRKRSKGKILRMINADMLSCLEILAAYDTEKFLSADRYDKLAELISGQFRCVNLKDFSMFCNEILAPKVVRLMGNCMDLAVWQSFTTKVLFNVRSANSEIRLQSLSFVSKALGHIGKDYAGLVGDVMPYVSQGLEDTEDSIVDISKTLLTQFETYCGEDIHNYLN